MRVAFLTNIVSPYRAPVFRRLAATPGWDLRVLVNAEREAGRRWRVDLGGLDVEQVAGWTWNRRVSCAVPVPFEQVIPLHLPWGLWGALARLRPDVVIAHELGPRSLVAAAYARATGTPLVLWAYQSRVSATQGRWRAGARRALLAQASAVVGMGRQAREVLEAWGVAPGRIVDAPNAADHAALADWSAEADFAGRVATARRRLGGRRLALVSGRLVPLKGVPELLALWRRLPAALRAEWRLVFAGSGPLRSLVRETPGAVSLGEVPARQLAALYAAADLHVFASLGDVWGLVVNEAAHCGTPSLCSVHAGCADDLIEPGRTGLLFDPTRPDSAARALEQALVHPDLPALGRRAQAHLEGFTLDRLAAGFVRAAEQARERQGRAAA